MVEPTTIPFSPIDEAVHLLDTEAAPWSIQMEVRVTGTLDEARLRRALAVALEAHPMARARKAAGPGTADVPGRARPPHARPPPAGAGGEAARHRRAADPARGRGATGETGYGFHHVSLSAERTGALRARHRGRTVNDVLLGATHLAISGWNAEHGERCGRIGTLVPANLRPEPWREEVVGNFSLPARVWTTPRSRRTPEDALRALTAQTRRKKKSGMGTALVEVLARADRLPLWAKKGLIAGMPVTGNRLVDTAMVSNIGHLNEPPSFGAEAGATVEMWFSPPARMPLGLTIGAATVAGRLHLVFRYRHRLFDAGAAARFAERFVGELDRLTESRPAA